MPPLRSHLATKHLILAELLDADLVPAQQRIQAALALTGPVAPHLTDVIDLGLNNVRRGRLEHIQDGMYVSSSSS